MERTTGRLPMQQISPIQINSKRTFFSIATTLRCVFITIILTWFAQVASANSLDPALINQFMSMSPAQQQALASQYGVNLDNVDLNGVSGGGLEPKVFEQEVSVRSRTGQENPYNIEQEPKPVEVEEESSSARYQAGKLVPFGYELFAGAPSTFTPVNDIPVSSDYILGPGDTLRVNLYGKESRTLEFQVDAEGKAHFPELGPIELAGLTFSEAKEKLSSEVGNRMIGMKASISMGQLKSIRVFVLGEAYVPGSYVISSLSTITNALVLSGGISETGSLRNIQLKRQGELVQTLDLYELLLNGDTRNDVSLRSGDVVFIPPVGNTAGVDGEVRRPAIYEINSGETLEDLLGFAGGLKPSAYPKKSTLERINDVDQKTVLNVDASPKELAQNEAQAGDILRVPSVLEKVERTIALRGHVYRPGIQSWREGLRLTDVISSVDQLRPGADMRYGLVKRYLPPQQTLKVLSFRLDQALANPNSDQNIQLKSKDEILVFGLYPRDQKLSPEYEALNAELEVDKGFEGVFNDSTNFDGRLGGYSSQSDSPSRGSSSMLLEQERSHSRTTFTVSDYEKEAAYWGRVWVIDEILQELRAQSEIGKPSKELRITGSVRYPGYFPLVDGMTVEDLIYAAGGLTEKAYKLSAEVNRTDFDSSQNRLQARYDIDLTQVSGREFEFRSRDVLQIRTIPEWVENHYVELKGEVRFPGVYPIHKDDSLRDVLERAGGVTEYAYVPGAVFTRVELKEQQERRLEEMQRRLAEDIAKAQLVEKDASRRSGDIGKAQELLSQLQQTPALGRLVIDLSKVIDEGNDYHIPLQNGDALTVPSRKNSVTIIGEVQLPISQVFEPVLDYRDYISRSGGTTDKADEDRIYVIKANGGVQLPDEGHWFASSDVRIDPGDTIVVPLDADKLDQLVLWRDMSQIFYQIALGAAAVGSL